MNVRYLAAAVLSFTLISASCHKKPSPSAPGNPPSEITPAPVPASSPAVTSPSILPTPVLHRGVVFFPTWIKPYPSPQVQALINNPAVEYALIYFKWSDFDLGNGKYDFSKIDALIAPWAQAGKKFALDPWPISPTVDATCGPNAKTGSGNCAIPNYVLAALGSQNTVMCSGGNGVQLIPNYLASAWKNNWFPALDAIHAHYHGDPKLIYIHDNPALEDNPTQGGWTDPSTICGAAFKRWGLTPKAWQDWTTTQLLHTHVICGSPCEFVLPLSVVGGLTPPLSDTVSADAAGFGIGLGTQALSSWDLTQPVGGVNWLKNMKLYPNVIHQLQTNKASNPTCGQPWASCPAQMGPLGPILDWATKNIPGAYVEIYFQDWINPANGTVLKPYVSGK